MSCLFFERAGTVLWTRERTQNRLLSMPAGGIVWAIELKVGHAIISILTNINWFEKEKCIKCIKIET